MKKINMPKYIALFFFFLFQGIAASVLANPFVDIQTNYGTIKVELKPDDAPITVSNFLHYVNTGFYDNTLFHRVIEDFMIQGGGFDTGTNLAQQETLPPIALESDNGLKNQRGTIAMARTSEPDSAKTQFFINSVDNDGSNFNNLDYQNNSKPGYAVFGQVTEGMNVVDSISKVKTGLNNEIPTEKVIIKTIRPREGDLQFKGLAANYAEGEVINVSLVETGIKRENALDLWVAVLLPNGKFLYLSKKDTFTFEAKSFKSAVSTEEVIHQVLNFTIPKGLAGHYTFFAIFNQLGADISNISHSLRSNLASKETNLTDK